MKKYLAFSIACAALAGCSSTGSQIRSANIGLSSVPTEIIEIQFLPAAVVAEREVTVVSAEPELYADSMTGYCEERRAAGTRIVREHCYASPGEAYEEMQRYYIRSEIRDALWDENRRIMEAAQGGQLGLAAEAVRDYR